nr:DNA-directed DNA polymerase [Tanacetum cinerariifolium]
MRTRSRSRHKIAEPLRIEFPSQEDQFQEDPPEVPMADNRTMAQLLQAPTVGYEDAIFFGHDKEDPHAHIRYFNKITSTMRVPNVPNSTIKLMLFPFLLEGAARIWLEPRSILTWDDLVSKFINQFFPPSKTTNLRNEITRFQQRFDESFSEAWDRFNDLLRACPHHGFSELHQLDTFYNVLNVNDQDSLNSATGGIFLNKMPFDCLKIIESKSKVRQSRAKAVVAKVNSSSSISAISSDIAGLKDMVRALLLDKKNQSSAPSPTPTPVKAVESNCVTCGEKLSEMARTPMNEHCSAVILNKLPKKLGDPDKFLIPCDECLALADLGASINLIPVFVWKEISLPKLTPTCMTLELADHSVSKLIGIAKDVKVEVGMFHFSVDFLVVDFEPDPRVLLILGRCFLKTGRALIDVHKGELTLRIENEAITYNLDQSSRYSANYDQMTANKIDVTDEACEEFSQEVLGFSNVTASGSPTPSDDPIVSTTSPMLTPFGDSDFLLLEESNAFLDHEQSVPSFKNELKACEAKTIKSSVDEPPEVKLKDLPPHLEYAFLEGDKKLPVIIAKELGDEEKAALIKAEKLLDAGLIHPIFDSPWVSPIHYMPKKGGFTVVKNEENELIPTHLVTGWRVCIDYRKLNEATRKDHFPLSFMDQMLERLAGNEYYCFLDGFSGYFQIPIDPRDQKKTTFTCPYGTFAYRRMPFGLCNAPGTFQRCMLAIFHDMVEKTMEVFMEDFSVFGSSFESCLSRLDKMLQRCEDTKLCLNWEKSPFMVKEGIVLGHKISKNGIEVDKAKVDVITKLPHPTTVKGAVLGQRYEKHFRPIHYASKTLTEAEYNYTTTEKEMLAVVYAFEKFRSYLIMNKCIVHTDHSALKYLFAKKDAKARLLRWVLLLQEFDFDVLDTKGAENLAADHMS